jgi:hypothetical protein
MKQNIFQTEEKIAVFELLIVCGPQVTDNEPRAFRTFCIEGKNIRV